MAGNVLMLENCDIRFDLLNSIIYSTYCFLHIPWLYTYHRKTHRSKICANGKEIDNLLSGKSRQHMPAKN